MPLNEWLFTQGILGVTTAVGIFVSGFFYRELGKEREKNRTDAAARETAHKTEIAQWMKSYMDLQNQRFDDAQVQLTTGAKQADLLKEVLQIANSGGRIEKHS